MGDIGDKIVCNICALVLPTKTQLFKHLEEHGFTSLYAKPERVVLLFGWTSYACQSQDRTFKDAISFDAENDTVENQIFRAIYAVENGLTSMADCPDVVERPRAVSRSSNSIHKSGHIVGMEASSHGSCDTMCFHSAKRWRGDATQWMALVNAFLGDDIRILDRIVLPPGVYDFQAETSCTQRRYEFMMPLNIIMVGHCSNATQTILPSTHASIHSSLHPFIHQFIYRSTHHPPIATSAHRTQ